MKQYYLKKAWIKAERVLDSKYKPAIKIIDFYAEQKENLPPEYINGKPHFYACNYGLAVEGDKWWLIKRGKIMEPSEFFEMVKVMRQAGRRVNKIMRKVRRRAIEWRGNLR
ncbi:MAG: hypothetical protein J7L56_03420 [Halomonas sp.]|nr:hypothetical protein [Halomonas sp.]MCD6437301.1 hypothetical protein [Halomonas sp.]